MAGCVLGVALAAPAARGQVTYTWGSAASGNYNVAANWTPGGGPPTVIDSVLIAATGSAYTVTLNDNRSITDFTLNSANATFSHTAGTYTLGGTMTLTSGLYNLGGGTIAGGTITGAAGRLRGGGVNSVLNNVLIGAGVLDMSTGGLQLTGGSNFAPSSVYALGSNYLLRVNQAAAVNNLDLTLGNNAAVDIATLVLGTSSALRLTGSNNATIYTYLTGSSVAGSFTNNGLIEHTGTGSLWIGDLPGGPRLGSWSNAGGVIRMGSGATVNLVTSVTSGNLGTFDRGGSGVPGTNGTLNMLGTMTMSGNLDLHTTTGTMRLDGGRINGGGFTLTSSGSSKLRATPTTIITGTSLDNVQLAAGVLDLSEANGQIELGGGSNFAPGSSYTTSTGFRFRVAQTQAVNNLNLTLGNNAFTHLRGNFTLGTSSAIRVTGSNFGVVYAGLQDTGAAGTFVNQGLLESSGTARLGIGRNITGGSVGGTWSNAGGVIRIGPTATVDLGADFSSGNLGTFDRGGSGVPGTNGTLNLIGRLTLTGNLDLHTVTGTLIGANSGQMLGGGFTLSTSGSSRYVVTSSTTSLNNVQLGVGVLDLSTSGGSLQLLGGSNFAPGSVYTTGSSVALSINQSAAINNLDLTLGNSSTVTVGTNGFTLGSSSTLRLTGANSASVTGVASSAMVNSGVIRNTSSGTLSISVPTFTNGASGLLDAQGGTTSIGSTWSNVGTIRLAAGASVVFGGSFSSASLGTIDRGGSGVPGTNGTLFLNGTLLPRA